MSFTNKTPNYNLPQWLGTDKPSYLVDFNNAFSDIDTGMKNNKDTADNASATASTALTTAQSAQETATTASGLASQAVEAANNATTIANNANTQAGTSLTNANTALDKADSALSRYKYVETDQNMIVGPGITINKTITPFSPFKGLMLFYYPGLKLMEISYRANASGTPTSYVPNLIANELRDFKMLKLPFTCTGSLTTPTYLMYLTDAGTMKYAYGTIRNINGETWVCLTSEKTIPITLPSDALLQTLIWLNVDALGEITLDGWEKIS